MRKFRPHVSSPLRSRRNPRRIVVVTALGAALLTAFVVALVMYLRAWSVSAAVSRALVLMQPAQSPSEIDDAFAAWEAETSYRWRGREAAVLEQVFDHHTPTERRVRAFLSCVVGADYGERRADWDRWHTAWKRAREGKPPPIKSDEAVRLDKKWEAAVGLTAWHSTVLPIDGQIYVASLGSNTTDADDPSDGLVRIDGTTGVASLIFVPPDRGPRDVLGIAAGDDSLFVACRNGTVYNVSPSGDLRWKTYVGGQIASLPLVADANRDQTADVLVVTQEGKVTALHGASGRALWSSAAPPGSRRSDVRGTLVQSSLATGELLSSAGEELLVASLAGGVRILSLSDGAQRWKGEVGPGCYGGPLVPDAESSPGRPAFIADGGGGIWSLLHSGRSVDALATWQLGSRATLAVVAAPRTLLAVERAPPWLLACSAGTAGGLGGSVFALAGDQVRWRITPGGVIWGTPAIADLNGDRRSEIIVGAMDGDAAGFTRGTIAVLSQDGHLVRSLPLPAPVECSPVVADVDGDGRLEVLVADRGGALHCFGTRGYGPVEWGLYGGDCRNTRNARRAYAYGQAPHGHQWRWRP